MLSIGVSVSTRTRLTHILSFTPFIGKLAHSPLQEHFTPEQIVVGLAHVFTHDTCFELASDAMLIGSPRSRKKKRGDGASLPDTEFADAANSMDLESLLQLSAALRVIVIDSKRNSMAI
jgi:hypothetical protein